MKRALALAVAAVGLIAWVDPKTVSPTATKEAVAEETKRQAIYLVNARWKEIQRVNDIAYRLEVANQDLCPERAPRLGISLATAEQFEPRLRDAAREVLQLGDGLSITAVSPQSPAFTAGLRPGDGLVSVGGESAPSGKKAAEKFAKQVEDKLAKDVGGSLTLVVRRGQALQTISVTPVLACAYDVSVEDSAEINAFADGRTIHILRPILKLTATDEELALVIAHELAHNGQHHIQAKKTNARLGGLGGLLLDGVAAAGGLNTEFYFTKTGAQIGAEHASVAFETEADYVGMYYLARAGYSTEGVETFWRKMAVESPEAVFIKTDHPATPDRFLAIAETSKEIEAKRAKGEPLVPNLKQPAEAKK